MTLIQSICCFFSGRCASGAAEPKKADQDGYARDAATAPSSPRPATPETEDSASPRP
jgi:hypothetical protein